MENQNARKIVGFDMFGEFPQATNEVDKNFRDKWVKETNNEFLTKEEIQKSFDLKGIKNIELVKGDIAKTLPEYLRVHPHFRVAFLHIDVDIYESTKVALPLIYNRVVKGGLIVLDDYCVAGETEAVEEFFADKQVTIQRLTVSQKKPSFIIKDEMPKLEVL